MMPRVSIITPTYNHAGYIGACIDSVFAQTFGDWEMLIVDDGSTDGTAEVVRRYDDPRVRLFQKANGGIMRLAEGYNLALREAKGDLLAILEGDDYWPADKLALQVPEFDDPNVVLVSGFAQIVDDEANDLGRIPDSPKPEAIRLNRPVGAATREMLAPGDLNFTFPCATMMRRSAVERIGGFRQPADLPLVDYPTFLAISLEGEFRFVERNCGYWRRHPASTTSSRFPQILNGCYREAMRIAHEEGARIGLTAGEIEDLELRWEEFQALRCRFMGLQLSHERRFREAERAFRLGSRFRQPARMRRFALAMAALSALRLPTELAFRVLIPEERGVTWKGGFVVGADPVVRGSDIELGWEVVRRFPTPRPSDVSPT